MTLTEFLLERIANDEAAAHRVQERSTQWRDQLAQEMAEAGREIDLGDWFSTSAGPGSVARVLAECKAKRRIVENPPEKYDDGEPNETAAYDEWDWVCKVLALPYADHPDFDPAWR